MHALDRMPSVESSSASRRDSRSFHTMDSCDSRASNPTTIDSEPRRSYVRKSKPESSVQQAEEAQSYHPYHDVSPGTRTCARSSVETYASTNSSLEDLADDQDDLVDDDIPPLPTYRHAVVEPDVRPCSPYEFADLFPSMDRLSIRHDEFTSDGNMNLRIDTSVSSSRHRRPKTVQLFHLRMHDLARREFSLRRYCRDSGREVCSSKRKYQSAPPASHQSQTDGKPTLTRSMSNAISRTILSARPQSKRSWSYRPGTSGSTGRASSHNDPDPAFPLPKDDHPRPAAAPAAAVATNVIKLEFSNYARVEVERKGKTANNSKRYDFEWWGQSYSWRRAIDKDTGIVSFHLLRRGSNGATTAHVVDAAIAHIVPEARSPVQVAADERAGGWVPPCHFWINDWDAIEAETDVADVILATGLVALVDDCIKSRWQTSRARRISLPLVHLPWDVEHVGPRVFLQRAWAFRRQKSAPGPTAPCPMPGPEDKCDQLALRPCRANYQRRAMTSY